MCGGELLPSTELHNYQDDGSPILGVWSLLTSQLRILEVSSDLVAWSSIAVKTHHVHHLPNPKPTLKLENRDWERHMVLQAGIHVLHGLNNGRTVVHAKEIVFFMNYFDSKVDFSFGSYCWRRHLSSFSKVQCNYSAQLKLTHALISSFGCVEWSMGYLVCPLQQSEPPTGQEGHCRLQRWILKWSKSLSRLFPFPVGDSDC